MTMQSLIPSFIDLSDDDNTLIWYDGPRLFVSTLTTGHPALFLNYEDGHDTSMYVVAPTTYETIERLKRDEIPIASVFDQPFVWTVGIGTNGQSFNEKALLRRDLDPHIIPSGNLTLHSEIVLGNSPTDFVRDVEPKLIIRGKSFGASKTMRRTGVSTIKWRLQKHGVCIEASRGLVAGDRDWTTSWDRSHLDARIVIGDPKNPMTFILVFPHIEGRYLDNLTGSGNIVQEHIVIGAKALVPVVDIAFSKKKA